MHRFVILGVVLVAGLVGSASAANMRGHSGYYQVPVSGLVRRDGAIVGGDGFTVAHPQHGEYVVSFQQGYFGIGECAGLVVQGIQRLLLTRVVPTCAGSSASFDVHLADVDGGPRDHDFMFVAVGMPLKN